MVSKLLWIAVAGAVGTLSRYGLAGLVQRIAGDSFPWGTFVVNALGCFLFGLVWMIAERHAHFPVGMRYALLVGFMGAFTTFSTYMFETVKLVEDAQFLAAAGNLGGQLAISAVTLLLGMTLGRLV